MAHKRTLESLTKHIDTEAHAKKKILELREEEKKQILKLAEQILKNQIAGMEERHASEAQIWAKMKLH